MSHEATTYRLIEGDAILIQHFDEHLRLTRGAAIDRRARRDLPRAA